MINKRVSELYTIYLNVIKPLLSEIEANYESFPEPLLNEIRAFNDHIARCYIPDMKEEEKDSQLEKAERHAHRMILDCYKYLNVYYKIQIEKFDKQTKRIDLTSIDNGDFFIKYRELNEASIKAVKEAKLKEYRPDGKTDFTYFEKAYNKYVELYDFITDNTVKIKWARAKYYNSKVVKLIYALIGAALTAAVKWGIPLILAKLNSGV